jgi:hypothetical protein
MAGSANVTSIDAIAAFGSALRLFEDEASRALLGLDEQAKGALEWLEHDAPVYWRAQIRRCFDDVARARSALETCKMKKVAGNTPACIEEQEAYRAARHRLRQAEEMIEVVAKWAQKVRREIDEYRGKIRGFRNCLEYEIPRTSALLERTVTVLESYADHPTVEAAREDGGGESRVEDRG